MIMASLYNILEDYADLNFRPDNLAAVVFQKTFEAITFDRQPACAGLKPWAEARAEEVFYN